MKKHLVRGDSYFPKVSQNIVPYESLHENISTDVVIVGGGITGALCAYYFAKNNIKTILIEKSKISMCSTSIVTAFLEYELDDLIINLEKDYKFENIIKGYKFGEMGLNELDNLVNQLKLDCDYKVRDTLLYTNDENKIDAIKYEYEKRKENGFYVDFIDNSTKKFNFSFDIKAGVYGYKGGAELNPVKFTHELIKEFIKLGGKVFEDTEIVNFHHDDNCVLLKTFQGNNVICKKVIVSTGYDISVFTNKSFASLYTTYNMVTSPIKNISGWHNQCLLKTAESSYTYLRTTPDNRIIIGGEDTRFIPELLEDSVAKLQYNKLEKKLHEMFPQLNTSIEYKYNGVFGRTDDNLPFIGPDSKNKNIWYCLGYGANGILFVTKGAKMLSNLYMGKFDENLPLVSPNRK